MWILELKSRAEDKNGARSFMSGVLLLSFSTVIVKIIGLAFKIPMLSFLGAEGMGYFNSAYEIYALLCVVSTAGLPVALSMLVSTARSNNDGARVKRVYRAAKYIFGIFGFGASLVMIVFSRQLADSIGNPDAYLCIMAIAPALLLVCLASAIRGYCQGFEYMVPTAVSQLIEAIGKLVFGMLLAMLAIKRGYPIYSVAAYAVFGITLGSFVSVVYLALAKLVKRPEKTMSRVSETIRQVGGEARELISVALPITLGSTVLGLTRIIDMALIMRRLAEQGIPISRINTVYGAYTTLALPVFSLIPALITPISMALIPQLSAFSNKKDREGERTVIENSVRLTTLLAMPASFGITLFSRPILEILFSGQSEAIDICAPLLAILGSSVLFSCLITTTNAVLQSYRHVCLPIVSMLAGVVIKAVSTYTLLGVENVGIMGAPIGSLLCNLTVVLINLCFMKRYTGATLRSATLFFKPLIASCISVCGAFTLYLYMTEYLASKMLAFAVAVIFAAAIYIGFAFLTGCLTKEDIMLFPAGERFIKFIDMKKIKNRDS